MDEVKNKPRLGVIPLAALVISAMIGGGIFSLPQNMAQGAAQGAVIAAWIITGIGMFFLSGTFRTLARECPEASAGIYAYSRIGFGRFAGFQMAWGYWLCNVFGNVGYAVLLMDAFDYFFPGVFTGGNNLWSIIGGSLIIWLMNFIVLRGVRQAAIVNVIGTLCKLVPIFLFIAVMCRFFQTAKFFTGFWGGSSSGEAVALGASAAPGSFGEQIRSTMLVTLWAFIGIEGAVVLAGDAKDQRDVGKATYIGFFGCWCIYILLSLLPFGTMSQAGLAKLANPSTAPLMDVVLHRSWGGDIMNGGVIIALLTSWLAFTIMVSQIPYAAALDGTFPKIFRQTNKYGSPTVSLFVTSALMQATMLLVAFAGNAWNTMLSITGVLILPPYLSCTLFLWQRHWRRAAGTADKFPLCCGICGTIYALWMIYAAGVHYLMLGCCLMLAGIPLFIYARKEYLSDHPADADRKIFSRREAAAAIILLITAGAALHFVRF